MPYLPDPISAPNVKQFYLPKPDTNPDGTSPVSDENKAWVKMDVQPKNGTDTMHQVSNFKDEAGALLAGRILEWNFIDAQGTPLIVNYENVMRIGQSNLVYLLSQLMRSWKSVPKISDDQKKTSTSTSTQ